MADNHMIVVGAGPAGMRAALTLVEAGLKPIVIDEAPASGGQIYRRQPANFTRDYKTLYGGDAAKAAALHQAFDAAAPKMQYRPDTQVWAVEPEVVHTIGNGVRQIISYDRLIIASGATDRIAPMPGWTLPGVYSLGASQIALKSQACVIGRNVVFIGTGPLLYLVAYQYLIAGTAPCAVLDTSSWRDSFNGFVDMCSKPSTLLDGMRFVRALLRAGVRVRRGVKPKSMTAGADGSVNCIYYEDVRGRVERVQCDAVGLGYHLRSETQLADLAQCEFAFHRQTRQWLPRIDAMGRSSNDRVYLAGDGVRILGADGAETTGALAAHALLADIDIKPDKVRIDRLLRRRDRHARFARGIGRAFPWPHQLLADLPDETIICRCESVSLLALRDAITTGDASEVNRVKALSRVGMGRCQGRFCGLASQELTAAIRGEAIEWAGRIRSQAPIKPLSMGSSGATVIERSSTESSFNLKTGSPLQ